MKELNKINEAITLVDDKIHQVLHCTGSKSYVNYTKESNLADLRDKIRNQEFLSQSTAKSSHDNDTKHKQILMHIFPSKEYQTMMCDNNNQLIPSTRRNVIRMRKACLICDPLE